MTQALGQHHEGAFNKQTDQTSRTFRTGRELCRMKTVLQLSEGCGTEMMVSFREKFCWGLKQGSELGIEHWTWNWKADV